MNDAELLERRRDIRHRVLKFAKILAVGEFPDTICEIQNMSAHGAELKVGHDRQLPDEFMLHVRSEQQTFKCRQIWRDGPRMGIEFI